MPEKLAVTVLNHGCKLNQYEGEALLQRFLDAGYKNAETGSGEPADIVVVNTCTVTEKSDRKSRHTIHKAAKRKQSGGLLVVTGCYAQTDPDVLAAIEGVDMIVGMKDKPRLVDLVSARLANRPFRLGVPSSPFSYVSVYPSRSRAFVKVQDGCDSRCAYCKVPIARGGSVSGGRDDIVSSVRKLAENGYPEIVLTGINLGDYRDGNVRLSGLIRLVLLKTERIRIRLSSLEPAYFEEGLFEVIPEKRVVGHFHIPLQSGSDRVLKAMNRPYDLDRYMSLIEKVRQKKPESHIATDLIVGFPTETEEDFQHTVRAVRAAEFASLHVFRYSKRNGTSGATLPNGVSQEVIKRRSERLIEMGRDMDRSFRERFIGTAREAVCEVHGSILTGITDNYIRVTIENVDPDRVGSYERSLVPVLIRKVRSEATIGRLQVRPPRSSCRRSDRRQKI
ncbi:MAG: tRNA (N(6)-L-threonylcarbamoyladenosine(37)-C(2))-methylthiotransferase MtaB [Spirochaetes bacterium]|nr:tRNA (N(6)-L-threonylcarbamoyladenosine(37)-C(2))-methylthiotransferase MtaB [Spirochaetota bacterium]